MAILDAKTGNIKSRFSKDRVILKGLYPVEKGQFADELELNVYLEGNVGSIIKKIPYGGYYMQLFLGDFLGNGRDSILVQGRFPGSGGIAILLLYDYYNGEIRELTNQWEISNRNKASIKYLPNYKIEIFFSEQEKYLLDISYKEKSYLNLIYDDKGNVKTQVNAEVSDINNYYVIKEIEEDKYDLLIRQNIIGIVLVDIIGIVQSKVVFSKDGKFDIKDRELVISRK
ncbi:hypothetical protein QYB59_000471 [Clostridium perfringens]|nr:hypothetical protein [Clostridium perfringens]